jgi:hypothetical protein
MDESTKMGSSTNFAAIFSASICLRKKSTKEKADSHFPSLSPDPESCFFEMGD